MFERIDPIPDTEEELSFFFDGRRIVANPGDSVASALLSAGIHAFRQSTVSGAPRGPFCMMGSCFECLVEIDGEKVQACMTPVQGGMEARTPTTPNHRRDRAND